MQSIGRGEPEWDIGSIMLFTLVYDQIHAFILSALNMYSWLCTNWNHHITMPNIGSFPASLYDFLWSLKQL